VCVLTPAELSADLATLRIGNPVVSWYQDEVTRLRSESASSAAGQLRWAELESRFFAPGSAPVENTTSAVAAG
jgi:hypothetical protein